MPVEEAIPLEIRLERGIHVDGNSLIAICQMLCTEAGVSFVNHEEVRADGISKYTQGEFVYQHPTGPKVAIRTESGVLQIRSYGLSTEATAHFENNIMDYLERTKSS